MSLLMFLVFVLLQTHQSVSRCQSCEQTSCDCSRQNLRQVPAAPSKPVAELDLSFNRLKKINKNDFAAYSSLRSLIVNNNIIKMIQEQAFVPLTNLEKLDLSSNRLETLSAEWFKSLLSLQHLDLLGNKYKMLGQGDLFHPLKRLKTLHLGGPYLASVRKSDFSGLSALDKLIFDGTNLRFYTEGSLKEIGPIKHVELSLNGPFWRNPALVEAILSDVVHPNSTLTFTDTFFTTESQTSPFKVVNDGGTRHFVLKNVSLTIGACIAVLSCLSDSNITMLRLEDTKFFLSHFTGSIDSPRMKNLHEIVWKNIEIPEFYRFPALLFLHPLLKEVRSVSVINSNLFAYPCEFSVGLSKVQYMDISGNILSDMSFRDLMCYGERGLRSLRTLNISRNHLRSINSKLFTKLDKLENIDMSMNGFQGMPETCHWPPRLKFLNLSSAHLSKVTTCLPMSLQVLDLSDNALTAFNVELPSLRELYISGNKLSALPEGRLYPHLTSLSIVNNNLQTLSSKNLNNFNNLSLEAGTDTYVCSCDFVAFMTRDLRYHRVTIGDESKSYICDSPDSVRGKSVEDARLSVFECHTALALSLLCSGILAVFLLVAGLCHKFSILWYMKMTWAWVTAKRKPKLKKGALEYDAFVSYSEMDSGWVEAHLVPELEQGRPPLQLCLHKRDFIPGGWILDNIIDAIEKSHKTLFVLSEHFVRSEWCKYELDYTHFRLFDQNDDAVVLVLLESIDTETIPKKFCKLRRFMNSRTYLKWPDDDNQIPRFWKNLRTAVKRPGIDNGNYVNDFGELQLQDF